MDCKQLTEERFSRAAERTGDNMGWGDTPGALAIASAFIEEATIKVEAAKCFLKPREHRNEVEELPSELIALVGMISGISSVTKGELITRSVHGMGANLSMECFGYGMKTWDEKRTKNIMALVTKKHGSFGQRKTALRSMAQKAKFPWKDWTLPEQAFAGRWLMEVMLDTDMFCLDDKGNLALTGEAVEVSNTMVAQLLRMHPIMVPLKTPPDPWVSEANYINGYRVALVRSHDKTVQRTIKEAFKTEQMDNTTEAVNAAQSVPWRINTSILEMVKWAHVSGVDVPGLPPVKDLPLPVLTKEWADMNSDEQRVYFKDKEATKALNRTYLGERLILANDMATADWIGDDTFWTPLNLDYRGRVYGIPYFNFQRQDYVRSLFEFQRGAPLDSTGLYWLQVHIANCGDFDKVSKRHFDVRVKWVEDNWERIISTVTNPKDDIWWTTADSPFLFLAACSALVDHYIDPSTPCRIPVSFDGSCSGLQHLGAMTRDEHTAFLVNLTNAGEPKDVYQVVANLAAQEITVDMDSAELGDDSAARRDLATRCIAYGVNRSLVKRNVMTFSYSSKAYGMSEQHREDTMKPLEYQVLRGKYDEHPFGPDNGYAAARYLAKTIYGAIENTVRLPAEAMAFLQDIARVMAHEGKPVIWHTPLGFPVVLRYPNNTTTRVKLLLHDQGIRREVKPLMYKELPGIDKRKAAGAIAPSFVHSLDACHLMSVVLASHEEGIRDIALVHDSFGCHANKAGRFREVIRETFHDQYANHDVLYDIWVESHGHLQANWYRMPELPMKGGYDINQVLDADYAFA